MYVLTTQNIMRRLSGARAIKTVHIPTYARSGDWALQDGPSYADAVASSHEYSRGHGKHNHVRTTALVCAVGVIAWTTLCVAVGLSRLDRPAFAQLRDVAPPAAASDASLDGRLQAANDALNKVSRQIFFPTLVVADASGMVNAPLPLTIRVTNYTADTTVNLSGLASGTVLSAGMDTGEGNWRVAVDDLPNARVIPPSDYIGPMKVVAELRRGDDQPIVRAPVHLIWNAPIADIAEVVEPSASNSLPETFDDARTQTAAPPEQSPAQRVVAPTTQHRRVNIRKHPQKSHQSAVIRRHRLAPTQQAEQTDIDARLASVPFNLFAAPQFCL